MSDAKIPSSRPPCDRADALAVLKRLRDAGYVAYFAGGCVRDELLGIQPKDYDVATDAPPQRVRELFSNTQAVGAAFGVILVRYRRSVVEVATFRRDDVYLDGRRPSKVHFATAEEDAKRRDFTINGLFLDPIENRVIDYVGGLEDLKRRLIRAIGDPNRRFDEDYLRMLRAVRFAARFGFEIEPATAEAIRTHAARLKEISPERIAEELRLMLTGPTRNAAWRMLNEFGLADVIFRFAPPADANTDVFTKLGDEPAPFGLVLAAALVSRCADPARLFDPKAAKAAARAMRQALRISNDEQTELIETLIGVGLVLNPPPPTLARKKRFLARPTAPLSRRLMRALAESGYRRQQILELEREFDALLKADYAPPPLITGDDLTAAGLQPGRLFKRLLDEVYDAQLEGRVQTREQALELALRLAAEAGGDATRSPERHG
ncbi:CCA tRNA nucleotidyltransferase [Fontivita pretiosa]|jgi:poly(A) polymerase|uniref:CCA tRNA nucleotidyltransferase n=1 Tax=Fontivita pretiosa TaxID=2989684 RepID=UPI003D16C5EE